jgi:hypothetical protein
VGGYSLKFEGGEIMLLGFCYRFQRAGSEALSGVHVC